MFITSICKTAKRLETFCSSAKSNVAALSFPPEIETMFITGKRYLKTNSFEVKGLDKINH